MVIEPYRFDISSEYHKTYGEDWNTPHIYYETWQDVEDGIERPCYVMQCTGLKSYDGFGLIVKYLYYGDIIRFVTTEGQVLIKQVWWSEEHQSTMIGNFEYYRLHESAFIQPSKLQFEIIGNIYENSDLIK